LTADVTCAATAFAKNLALTRKIRRAAGPRAENGRCLGAFTHGGPAGTRDHGLHDDFGDRFQTGQIENFPVVLIGTDYWRGFQQMLARMAAEGTNASSDLELMLVTDDIAEAMAHIRRHAIERFGLRRVTIRPVPLPGEATRISILKTGSRTSSLESNLPPPQIKEEVEPC
jgi:hypothetical protein